MGTPAAEAPEGRAREGPTVIAAIWVLAIALAATIGTIVIDASRGRIEGWVAAFLVWLFAIPSDVDDRPARHPRVRAHLLSQLRPPELHDGATDL